MKDASAVPPCWTTDFMDRKSCGASCGAGRLRPGAPRTARVRGERRVGGAGVAGGAKGVEGAEGIEGAEGAEEAEGAEGVTPFWTAGPSARPSGTSGWVSGTSGG